MNEKGRKHLDLFSGIGGFALASKWAGLETIGFSETDKYCGKVLKKNFPNVENFGDIKDIDGRKFKNCFLLTGGFPCQPFSLATAGQRKGSKDDRALWYQMARIIQESKPLWVLGENVFGLVSMGLDQVLDDLESLNYSTEAIIIPSCALDAPHRRDRVWILGRSNDQARKLKRAEDLDDSIIPNTFGKRCEKQWESLINEQKNFGAKCSDRWKTEPELSRVVDGLPNRVDRNRGLGNAIVPQVATTLIKMMIQIDES